jgi:uncharacterized membrane protein YdbT with pleckstrin-like domain
MGANVELREGEQIIRRTRPAWRSFWVFALGVILVGLGPLIKEDAPIRLETGLVFAAVFAVIILRRWSDVYTITNERIIVRGGLIARDNTEIRYEDVARVEANQGINLRLVGAGHILISTKLSHQDNIIMYGQVKPHQVKEEIEELVARKQVETGGGK